MPVRAEILSGDLRPLYLLWLLGVQAEELDGDEVEPPVPAGLRTLTVSQTALAEFLRLDRTCSLLPPSAASLLFRPAPTSMPGSRASPRESATRC